MKNTKFHRVAALFILMGLAVYTLNRFCFYPKVFSPFVAEKVDISQYRTAEKHANWIVVTSIQSPTPAVKQLVSIKGWRFVVVGDLKTPTEWSFPGVTYLSPSVQLALGYKIHPYLPYNSYTRKMIGYLYAIEHGAQYIYETDDDNFASDLHIFMNSTTYKGLVVNTEDLAFNPYPHFGQATMWPRGYPLDQIGRKQPHDYTYCSMLTPIIQQGLVHGDPDVDAIFRMTRYLKNDQGLKLRFDEQAPSVTLPRHVYAPYNSQNTFSSRSAFWSLYFFISVTDRETDIYRSYWAQTLIWLTGNNIAFFAPYFDQNRNAHSYLRDARDEIRLYTQIPGFIQYMDDWECSKETFFECILDLTHNLASRGFLEYTDIQLLYAWLEDLSSLDYVLPEIKRNQETCYLEDEIEMSFYPWQQNTSVFYSFDQSVALSSDHSDHSKQLVSSLCSSSHQLLWQQAYKSTQKYENVLLIITIADDMGIIPVLNALYTIHFPHILYCGTKTLDKKLQAKWKVTYVPLPQGGDAMFCTAIASDMNYHVSGYFQISHSTLLNVNNLHLEKDKDLFFIMDPTSFVLDKPQQDMCNSGNIKCIELDKSVFDKATKLKPLSSNKVQKCFQKLSSYSVFTANKVIMTQDVIIYFPAKRAKDIKSWMDYFGQLKRLHTNLLVSAAIKCNESASNILQQQNSKTLKLHKDKNQAYDYVHPFEFGQLERNSKAKETYCNLIEHGHNQ